MKTLMMALGLAALMTAPALAQSGAGHAVAQQRSPATGAAQITAPLYGQSQFRRIAAPSTAHEAVGRSETFYGPRIAVPPDLGSDGSMSWQQERSPRLYPDGN